MIIFMNASSLFFMIDRDIFENTLNRGLHYIT